MADLGHSLMIKYGLSGIPVEDKIKSWVGKTREYISQRYEAEKAGDKAAREVFSDYGKMIYAAEADTILALLAMAGNK